MGWRQLTFVAWAWLSGCAPTGGGDELELTYYYLRF
jgi:hypothetical protein